MKEFELAILASDFLGIPEARVKEMEKGKPVNFGFLVRLGERIKALNRSSIRNLKVKYSLISKDSKTFGPLHKMGFHWYFGSNTNLSPYQWVNDFPIMHKVGFILNEYKKLKVDEISSIKPGTFQGFKPTPGAFDFIL